MNNHLLTYLTVLLMLLHHWKIICWGLESLRSKYFISTLHIHVGSWNWRNTLPSINKSWKLWVDNLRLIWLNLSWRSWYQRWFVHQVINFDLLWRSGEFFCLWGLKESRMRNISYWLEAKVSTKRIDFKQYFTIRITLATLEFVLMYLSEYFKICFDPRVINFKDGRFITLFENSANESYHIS